MLIWVCLTTSTYDVDLGLSDDVKIVQVSDLHNQFFGINQSVLLKNIEACDPDIIVVTGDIVDSTHTSYSIAMDFIEGAVKIAPVYYVTGNHENRLHGDKLDKFYDDMRASGVIFLDDTYVDMGEYTLAGIADSSLESFDTYPAFTDEKPVVMLAHEPDYVSLYQSLGADLVLTGHVHGGQIIIPGKGGLLSPDFTFFPELYEGMHSYGSMTLIVSRGLGNSVAPVRINNFPELVVINVT